MPFEGELPLYQQLAELLKEEIHAGRYKQGQNCLPNWNCVSCTTSAATQCAAPCNSWKKRICCCGNRERELCQQKKYNHHIVPARSFTDMCREIGCKPDAKVIKSVIKDPSEADVVFLDLRPEAKIIAIERIRYTDGVPVELEISHFPESFSFFARRGPEPLLYAGTSEGKIWNLVYQVPHFAGSHFCFLRNVSLFIRSERLSPFVDQQ